MHFLSLLAILSPLLILATVISHDHKVGQGASMAKAYHFSIVTEHKVDSVYKQSPVAVKTWEHNNETNYKDHKKRNNAAKLKRDHDQIKQTDSSQNKIAYTRRNADISFQISGIQINSQPAKGSNDKVILEMNQAQAQDTAQRKVHYEDKQIARNATIYLSAVTHSKL